MTPQDKLGFGMIVFLVVFVTALFFVPASLQQRYLVDLQLRRKGRWVKALLGGVFILALPYFYDQLVGLSNRLVAQLLEIAIGACAYLVLIDVAWFLYRHLGPPSLKLKRLRK